MKNKRAFNISKNCLENKLLKIIEQPKFWKKIKHRWNINVKLKIGFDWGATGSLSLKPI